MSALRWAFAPLAERLRALEEVGPCPSPAAGNAAVSASQAMRLASKSSPAMRAKSRSKAVTGTDASAEIDDAV